MPARAINDNVRRFLGSCIPTVPHLECLLLLSGSKQHEAIWDCPVVAARLYQTERATQAILDDLVEAGLVTRDTSDPPTFRYSPRTPEIEAVVRQVAETYNTHLIDVTRLIHSNREPKARRFADAFRWRKE